MDFKGHHGHLETEEEACCKDSTTGVSPSRSLAEQKREIKASTRTWLLGEFDFYNNESGINEDMNLVTTVKSCSFNVLYSKLDVLKMWSPVQ